MAHVIGKSNEPSRTFIVLTNPFRSVVVTVVDILKELVLKDWTNVGFLTSKDLNRCTPSQGFHRGVVHDEDHIIQCQQPTASRYEETVHEIRRIVLDVLPTALTWVLMLVLGLRLAFLDALNGHFNRQIADTYTELLLDHMRMPDGNPYHPTLPTWITPEEHIKAWKRAKERTGGGPSMLTFSMFKANCLDMELATLDAALRNIAYQTRHVYPRWLKGIDCQLLKRSKDKRVEKMRTILRLEADFNMNNKKFGRELMWTAEANGTLTRDNYGGRKHLRSVETSLNQYLTYDSIRARRSRAITCPSMRKGATIASLISWSICACSGSGLLKL